MWKYFRKGMFEKTLWVRRREKGNRASFYQTSLPDLPRPEQFHSIGHSGWRVQEKMQIWKRFHSPRIFKLFLLPLPPPVIYDLWFMRSLQLICWLKTFIPARAASNELKYFCKLLFDLKIKTTMIFSHVRLGAKTWCSQQRCFKS